MLTDFFRINMPYGMRKNNEGQWMCFNREYLPLGWNTSVANQHSIYGDFFANLPVSTKYKGLTDSKLQQLAWGEDGLEKDDEGKITMVFFYNDRTNPMNDSKYWNAYFDKLKFLSKSSVVNECN
jgi:hypothetical protein